MAIDILSDETTISETAERFGISLRTLRFYEDKGLIKPIRVGTSRIYTNADRVRLQLIVTGKRLGFSLSQIQEIIGEAAMSADKPKREDKTIEATSLVSFLSTDEIGQQLQIAERQRNELNESIDELKKLLDSPKPAAS